MKNVRKSTFLMLLVLGLVVWGCSNGGGGPTAPPAYDSGNEVVTADAKRVKDDSSFELAMGGLGTPDPTMACSGSAAQNCFLGFTRKDIYTLNSFYVLGEGADNLLLDGTTIGDWFAGDSCVQDVMKDENDVNRFLYTNAIIVQKESRSTTYRVTVDFFITWPKNFKRRFLMILEGTLADNDPGTTGAGFSNVYPPLNPGGHNVLNITSASFTREHGRSDCDDTAPAPAGSIVRLEKTSD